MDDPSEIRKIMETLRSEQYIANIKGLVQKQENEIQRLKRNNRSLADDKIRLIVQNQRLERFIERLISDQK